MLHRLTPQRSVCSHVNLCNGNQPARQPRASKVQTFDMLTFDCSGLKELVLKARALTINIFNNDLAVTAGRLLHTLIHLEGRVAVHQTKKQPRAQADQMHQRPHELITHRLEHPAGACNVCFTSNMLLSLWLLQDDHETNGSMLQKRTAEDVGDEHHMIRAMTSRFRSRRARG